MSESYNPARERAKSTLTHYMRHLFKAAGLPWTSDTTAEIEGIVDDLIEAAQHEVA